MPAGIAPRDDLPPGWVREGDWIVPWWHSTPGIIVRWVIFLVFSLLIIGYVVGGYWHAKRRIKKGLPPLAYHKCLVRRRTRQPQHQNGWPTNNQNMNQPANGYYMNDMGAPPTYDPSRPPMYTAPPEGATKVDPSQWGSQPTNRPAVANPAPDYTPSAGNPPPGSAR
ncbi:hypothetical protein DCS_06610 [Drechmeria coniospora]|uniref:Ubiquitin-protein ligase sel1 n=1 Tax=Drechmeria coniospora TaxID=98403 RepID=A0A151GC28_DRECN|nr:hypothetical protein DCS_06610 [Drechmeria coniospora]KYK54650.1 hypothetical protein DCS_06610 [Drechmeria coniospora]ODA76124.1 hypothetical protein RJ55_08407 [Drechmeria coniospora]